MNDWPLSLSEEWCQSVGPHRDFGYSARAWRPDGVEIEHVTAHDGVTVQRGTRYRKRFVCRIGIGGTPEQAIADLKRKLAAAL